MVRASKFISALFGCLYAGVVAAPTPRREAATHAERCVTVARDCGATLLLTDSSTAGREEPLIADLLVLAPTRSMMRRRTTFSLSAWCADLAYLQYTSGSISAPRA